MKLRFRAWVRFPDVKGPNWRDPMVSIDTRFNKLGEVGYVSDRELEEEVKRLWWVQRLCSIDRRRTERVR
jgi:hypothetical protein